MNICCAKAHNRTGSHNPLISRVVNAKPPTVSPKHINSMIEIEGKRVTYFMPGVTPTSSNYFS
jgi:hypothetical protein